MAENSNKRGRERHIALFVTEIQYRTAELHRKQMTFYSLHTRSFDQYLLNINFA